MNKISTPLGLVIAIDYNRIVHGGRGDYIEINPDQIIKENIHIPKDQSWRKTYPKCYYLEYRSNDDAFIKIYYQMQLVKYADYKIGKYYISISDINLEGSE